MTEPAPRRIILTGFSGTGKSTIARLAARRLGWDWIDTDAAIEEAAGRTIPEIFASDGEPAFRTIEARVLRGALTRMPIVVATGGGAVLLSENRRAIAEAGFVVCLQAWPERVTARTRTAGHRPVRPLLAGDPAEAARLQAERAPIYAKADWTVHTDALSSQQAAKEVVRAYELYAAASLRQAGRVESFVAEPPGGSPAFRDARGAVAIVRATTGTYPIYVERGALHRLGEYMTRCGLSGTAHVIGDERVLGLHHAAVEEGLATAGFATTFTTFEPGEASKSLDRAMTLYDRLVASRAERSDAVVAIGGGVAGDLAGFVAATYLRGLPLVQVPTTLLGMVDASIGGKVAVNHREGKNLIGAIYQPRLVLADTALLSTLPVRELTSGWAEVIKHALIMDEGLLELLEQRSEEMLSLTTPATEEVIARSAALKARVVSRDEREAGPRMALNYGHTVGHGIEAATAYGRFLHGEAVAIGMAAAVRISQWLGLVDEDVVRRQDAVLRRYGLPLCAEGLDTASVRAAMTLDKKVKTGAIRWVLLDGIGRTTIRADVPVAIVDRALDEVLT